MSRKDHAHTHGPIHERWLEYRREVMDPRVGPVQVLETRRAFYAGASAVLEAMSTGLDPATADVTEDDLGLMDRIGADLTDFVDTVGTPAEDQWDRGAS